MDLINLHVTLVPQKRKLNYCCIYLQVTHVSDISTSDRKRLHQGMLTKLECFDNQYQTLNWPEQSKPDKTTQNLWNQTLRRLLCTNNDYLQKPLGRWLYTFKQWYAYFNLTTQETYIYSKQWTKHKVKTKM